jgi:hypothetical protein
MSADLTAATASYRSLLIELRDDISRARQHSDIVSLATDMGPAITAGMLEPVSFEAGLQGDTVLKKLIEERSASIAHPPTSQPSAPACALLEPKGCRPDGYLK